VLYIKDSGDKNRVHSSITFNKITCSDTILDAHGLGACNHLVSSFPVISFLESIKSAVLAVKLIENIDESLRVLKILAKILDLRLSGSSKMEIHPAKKNLL